MEIKITTTFKQLHDTSACPCRYRHLAKALGGIKKYGRMTPINLLTILKHNGLADFFWVLEAVVDNQDATVDAIGAEGPSWHTKKFWDSEGASTRRARIVSIKRYLE